MTAATDPHRALLAPNALLPGGWATDVLLAWDETGALVRVEPCVGRDAAADLPRAAGVVVPGMPNLHSHAFQRAFAGLAEHRAAAAADDSFWTWRDLMYRFALAVSPDQLEAIATQLYVEMLQAGFTSVCEFHYLHHDPAGAPYADPAEMALQLVAAARAAGIGLTLLPVLYQHAGFGAARLAPEQRRFAGDVDFVLDLVGRLRRLGAHVGVAPHSLRAVAPAALAELVAGMSAIDPAAPIHVHVAEQQQEVDACVAWCGQRPVQWLLDHAAVDARWCLVHATHADAAERRGIAAAGATVGLCPTTEANLGDGVFDAPDFVGIGGRWGIGSDSHASVDAAEELRWLEYGQRLAQRRRNVLHGGVDGAHVADRLWLGAVSGGAQAAGGAVAGGDVAAAGLAVGRRADFVVLGGAHRLAGLTPSQALASHVFAHHGTSAVRDVWVGGRQVVAEGRHALQEAAEDAFVDARTELLREA